MSSYMRMSVLSGRSGESIKAWLRLQPGFRPEVIERFGSLFSDVAGGVHSGLINVATNAVPATGTITLTEVAPGDTVTIGTTVFTGATTPDGSSQFQAGVAPSVSATSLASAINANEGTECLVLATANGSVVTVMSLIPGVIGNLIPIAISAGGTVSGAGTGPNVTLLTASSYAALAKSAISNSGNTVLTGDLGITPNTLSSVTGWTFSTSAGPGVVVGATHFNDAAAIQAEVDATAAAVALQATGPGTDISATDLGGYTATPGTYSAAAAGTWSAGPLILNGAGTYIFLFGTALTLPANASIVLTNGATADNVYFVTGTAFTFGVNNTTYGNVLAGSAITTASLTNHTGRLLIYGVSGTAISFPSAATVVNPAAAPVISGTLSGGTEDPCVVVYNGIRLPPGTGTI